MPDRFTQMEERTNTPHRSWSDHVWARHSRVVEALVPRACERETLGKRPSAAAPVPVRSVSGAWTSICVHLFLLRIVKSSRKAVTGNIRLSATDLSNHLACHHLTSLDLAVLAPTWHSPDAQVFQERGTAHGNAYLAHRWRCSGSGRRPEPDLAPFKRRRASATLNSQLDCGVTSGTHQAAKGRRC